MTTDLPHTQTDEALSRPMLIVRVAVHRAALEPPAGVDASAAVKRLREVHGITVAGGQDHTKGKMLRIGHMGSYDLSDIYVVLGALEECTNALGHKCGGAIEAARGAWEAAS